MAYAENTTVSTDRSKAEIERTLSRYGAVSFIYGWDQNRAIVGFTIRGRQVRFELPMPDRQSPQITRTATGRARTALQIEDAYDKATRQRWRALLLVIKAKLEAVESGIVTFEQEFAMWFSLPDGTTVSDHVIAEVDRIYETGLMSPTLLGLPAGSGGE